jgi:thymidylate kinase
MNSKRGKLAIVVGIDGAGKTSALTLLDRPQYVLSHWSRTRFARALPEKPGRMIKGMNPAARNRFLAGFIAAEWSEIIQPATAAGKSVVSDGFLIRFLAKESVLGLIDLTTIEAASPLDGSELFIFLDVDPEIARRRRPASSMTPYEFFEGPDDFIDFQTQQRDALRQLLEARRYIRIDANREPGQVAIDLRRELDLFFKDKITEKASA